MLLFMESLIIGESEGSDYRMREIFKKEWEEEVLSKME